MHMHKGLAAARDIAEKYAGEAARVGGYSGLNRKRGSFLYSARRCGLVIGLFSRGRGAGEERR